MPLLSLARATPALAAATAAPGYAVSDFATGFSDSGPDGIGPVGLAFDGPGLGSGLYVLDFVNGTLYRFSPSGGVASPGTRIGGPLPGRGAGIAFSLDYAYLYVARQSAGDVVEVNAATGAVVRTVATGIPCATGIATDPLSGDLFVSEGSCSSEIIRLNSSSGAKSSYATVAGADGLSFDPRDGTLYAASAGANVAVIDRGGNVRLINPGSAAASLDGVAVAASRVPGQPPFIFVNENNGVVSKVDLTTRPPATLNVMSRGTRGDFVTVGPDGCLYATQTDRILRVTNADGSCSLAPPDPAITALGSSISAVEGAPVTGTVAAFTDPDVLATADEYSATIHWGDGASTTGAIAATGTPGLFSVSGTHAYGEEGSYSVQVDVVDVDTPNNAATATSPASVADAALSTSGSNLVSPDPVSGIVAHFTDADPAGVISDYSASIDWGDGSGTAGSISAAGAGFDVSGTHSYTALGPYMVNVHICDVGGSCADATTQVIAYSTSSGGAFVIGDGSTSGTVTFWGAQWGKSNSLSGGTAPAAFKGVADANTPAVPACGGTWTARPGDSSRPPASVRAYMAVIVSSCDVTSGVDDRGPCGPCRRRPDGPGIRRRPGAPGNRHRRRRRVLSVRPLAERRAALRGRPPSLRLWRRRRASNDPRSGLGGTAARPSGLTRSTTSSDRRKIQAPSSAATKASMGPPASKRTTALSPGTTRASVPDHPLVTHRSLSCTASAPPGASTR